MKRVLIAPSTPKIAVRISAQSSEPPSCRCANSATDGTRKPTVPKTRTLWYGVVVWPSRPSRCCCENSSESCSGITGVIASANSRCASSSAANPWLTSIPHAAADDASICTASRRRGCTRVSASSVSSSGEIITPTPVVASTYPTSRSLRPRPSSHTDRYGSTLPRIAKAKKY